MFTGVVYLACCQCHIHCLASNLLSIDIGADSNIGRVGPSHVGGSNSVGTVASKRGSNMGIGQRRGNNMGSNVVVGGQWSGNMVVGGGERGGNMVVGGGQRGGNMVVSGGQRGRNMVVSGG